MMETTKSRPLLYDKIQVTGVTCITVLEINFVGFIYVFCFIETQKHKFYLTRENKRQYLRQYILYIYVYNIQDNRQYRTTDNILNLFGCYLKTRVRGVLVNITLAGGKCSLHEIMSQRAP